MSDQLLDIDVGLVLARYGKRKVLEAIARLGDQTLENLQQQLSKVEQKKRPRPTVKPSLVDLAATESRDRPEIAEPLRALAVAFENRSFLPTLRDTQRFLDRLNTSQGKLKSRASAGPTLIRALSRLTLVELVRVNSEQRETAPGSDYSTLARAIMGKPTMSDDLYGSTRDGASEKPSQNSLSRPEDQMRLRFVELNRDEKAELDRPVKGTGGFEGLLRRLQKQVDHVTSTVKLTERDLTEIPRYAFDFKQGGWQKRLVAIFGRSLGSRLGREE